MHQGPLETAKLRTWSHLSGQRRKPSEYEIVSVDIHFHNDNNGTDHQLPSISKNAPINEYYRKYLTGSPLKHPDWSSYRDPDEMTYRTYNIIQDGQERYVEGLLDRFNEEGHDRGLSPEWLGRLARFYAPSRYLQHAIQMASAYGAQVAPASSMAIASAFQSADALRWVSHVSYRTAELGKGFPQLGFTTRERAVWEEDPAWQGFRELAERCLATLEWGEAFVVLNAILKPAADEVLTTQLGYAARRNNDDLLALLTDAQRKDIERSRRWSRALMALILSQPENVPFVKGWMEKWRDLSVKAVRDFCREFGQDISVDHVLSAVADVHVLMGLTKTS